MARKQTKNAAKRRIEAIPDPKDVLCGIPDSSPNAAWWKYGIMAAAFLGWIALLCSLAVLSR